MLWRLEVVRLVSSRCVHNSNSSKTLVPQAPPSQTISTRRFQVLKAPLAALPSQDSGSPF